MQAALEVHSKWKDMVLDKPLQAANRVAAQAPQLPRVRHSTHSSFSRDVLGAADDEAAGKQQAVHARVQELRRGDHAELERTPLLAKRRLAEILTPPEAAFAFQPWRSPIQRTVDSLSQKNAGLQRQLTSLYYDAHLRLYMADMLTPADYVKAEGGSLDASLLSWIRGQFTLDGEKARVNALPTRLTHPEFFLTDEDNTHSDNNKIKFIN
jgi:hypothetical protein